MTSLERSAMSPSVTELLGRLTDGIEALVEQESWRRFLAAQSRFHRYSYNNTLLILAQCPDARSVAGFSTWRRMGRAVRKGERAIWIVAPLLRTSSSLDAHVHQSEIRGFRRVAVFDVSQTDGVDLAEICRPLEGPDGDQNFVALRRAAVGLGFRVEEAEMPVGTYGDCTYATRMIRVSVSASPAQRVKTLAHELSHAILHERCVDRALAELEAESAAYVVCQHLGLDTAAYSFGYVATWAGGSGAALEDIRSSCGRISVAARRIIELSSSPEFIESADTDNADTEATDSGLRAGAVC